MAQLNQEKEEVEAIAGRREKDNKELIAIVEKLENELGQDLIGRSEDERRHMVR